MNLHKNEAKHLNDARYVSEAVGCVLLLSMLLFLLLRAWVELPSELSVGALLFQICEKLFIFVLPAAWGVWMIRRSNISFAREMRAISLYKTQTVILSSFSVIVILQMLYASVFPEVQVTVSFGEANTPAQIFLLFLSVSFVPAVAEEILFRGFMIRSLRLFRKSLTILMSSIAFALMHFSVTGFPLFFACGLILGMAYISTGSLGASIAIHFLCNAYWFLSETVEVYLPEYGLTVTRAAFSVCVLFCVMGIPFLKENIRVFLEDQDENFIPSSRFWTLPTILFVLIAAVIQIFFQ